MVKSENVNGIFVQIRRTQLADRQMIEATPIRPRLSGKSVRKEEKIVPRNRMLLHMPIVIAVPDCVSWR